MYFCIIYNYLYNLQLCLICMEMKLMDNKILLNVNCIETTVKIYLTVPVWIKTREKKLPSKILSTVFM